MKLARALLIVVLVSATTPSALAMCTGCMHVSCEKNGVLVDTTECGTEQLDTEGPGVRECKTVRNCGGCMGYSCYVQDPINTRAPQQDLVPAGTVVRVRPAPVAHV